MGRYVNNSLITGEQVVYEGHYHWSFWIIPLCWIVALGLLGGILFMTLPMFAILGVLPIAVAVGIFGWYYLKYTSDEMVVTNRRVIIKTGIISRDTFELQLQKVECIGVDQSIWGRIFNFGTITGTGTGGSKGFAKRVSSPLVFRKAFQEAAAIYDEAWRATAERYNQNPTPKTEEEC